MSDEVRNTNANIQFNEDENTITKSDEIAECFNSYCTTITETLSIEKAPTSDITEPFSRPVVEALQEFILHQSIIEIKQMIPESDFFEFCLFKHAEV